MGEGWLERWEQGRIGWHEPGGNIGLMKYWPPTDHGTKVLVPLCGKAADLKWLADAGCSVTGIEISRIAVEAFFTEQGLKFQAAPQQGMTRYTACDHDITLYCGDFFEFEQSPFDALYDRGALVAVPDAMRPAYAQHVDRLLSNDATLLLITLEYDATQVAGPPFSVLPKELNGYWPDLQRVAEREDIDNAPPKFRAAGLQHMAEVVWRSG